MGPSNSIKATAIKFYKQDYNTFKKCKYAVAVIDFVGPIF